MSFNPLAQQRMLRTNLDLLSGLFTQRTTLLAKMVFNIFAGWIRPDDFEKYLLGSNLRKVYSLAHMYSRGFI